MVKAPASQFYWHDFDRDTEHLDNETLGGYMRILKTLWFSDTQGKAVKTLCQWARILRCDITEAHRVITVLRDENTVTVITGRHGSSQLNHDENDAPIKIINRRMHREYLAKKTDADRSQRYRDRQKGQPVGVSMNQSRNNKTPSTSTSTSTSTTTSSSLKDSESDSGHAADDVILQARNLLDDIGFTDSKVLVKCVEKAKFVLKTVRDNPRAGGGLVRNLITNEHQYKRFKNDLDFDRECHSVGENTRVWSPKRLTEGIWKADGFDGFVVEIKGEKSVEINLLSDLREWVLMDSAEGNSNG